MQRFNENNAVVETTDLPISAETRNSSKNQDTIDSKYRVLVENSLQGMMIAQGIPLRVVYANESMGKILGYSLAEFTSLSSSEVTALVYFEDRTIFFNRFKDRLEGKQAENTYEFRAVRKDGSIIWLEAYATLIEYNGKPAVQSMFLNIDKRKKVEEALRKSDEEYSSLFANMIDGFAFCQMIFDASGKPDDFVYLQINEAFEKITGLEKDKVIGKKVTLAIPGIKEATPELFEIYGRVAVTGQKEKFEIFFKPLNIWLNVSVYSPRKGYFAAIFEDITERKTAEASLKEIRDQLDLQVKRMPIGCIVWDKDFKVISFNPAAEKIFGYSVKEMIGKYPYGTILPKEEQPIIEKIWRRLLEGDETANSVNYNITKGGKLILCSWSNTPLKLEDNSVIGVLSMVQDITERKKAEESVKFQADLLNHVGQAIIMVDKNQEIRFWNKAAEKLYGWTEEQAIGHKVTELLGGTSADEADEITKRLIAGESWSTEILSKNRDGSVVPIILNRTPIYNQVGEFLGAASISTDITLQKTTEADLTYSLTSLSRSLDKIQELNEKLRVIGGLTRHDVRNKLSSVNGYTYLLKKKYKDQLEITDGLNKIEQSVQEIVKIFDFAKIYEQIGVEELTYINVGQKIDEARALFSGSMPTLTNECQGLTVLADSFLRQMFYNFMDNTRKYGKTTKTIRVYFEEESQNQLKLIYEDDGVGVPFENKQSLFKEGFSTGGSTGFGLFLTKKMIDVYGWLIQEVGEPGKGAKFVITIPKLNKEEITNFQINLDCERREAEKIVENKDH
ncbi:MAG TPA: PAS domain-containing sensor histidine kinase [Candidatus Acidoferrum sp.]|nr:PAS domain-containing sensor histidine kinase [Candidatus Acidoferrum sp.]